MKNESVLLAVICIFVATIFLTMGLFVGYDAGMRENEPYKKGWKQGYHDARLIYECDHDNTECEILTTNK